MTNAADGRAEREIVERILRGDQPARGGRDRGRPGRRLRVVLAGQRRGDPRSPGDRDGRRADAQPAPGPRPPGYRRAGPRGRGLDRRLRRWRALAEHQPVRVPGGPDHGQDRTASARPSSPRPGGASWCQSSPCPRPRRRAARPRGAGCLRLLGHRSTTWPACRWIGQWPSRSFISLQQPSGTHFGARNQPRNARTWKISCRISWNSRRISHWAIVHSRSPEHAHQRRQVDRHHQVRARRVGEHEAGVLARDAGRDEVAVQLHRVFDLLLVPGPQPGLGLGQGARQHGRGALERDVALALLVEGHPWPGDGPADG